MINNKRATRSTWLRPRNAREAGERLDAVNASIRENAVEYRLLRRVFGRMRPGAASGGEHFNIYETVGKSVYVQGLLLAELRTERASLRRWITNQNKKETSRG
jgi:hypothetical protein